ncbi:Inosine/uridine-preferring nucleoside hydrolase domain-containing protein [Crucibulum laeve]|uniref:Inosine/uridine-preferring nucleoside hydrolase domain-containing protein n=1 Tax=Crucibulum laeve TaxID=68775 RepID=A0A5C3MGK5_9AGAR|nr:Inosine/uridine-preferring nucleoside hydrolase domain-containing protein [Crucibulum laeve]
MNPVPVIIDTDPGVDDVVAILLALSSPELQILSFIVTFGNTDVEASYLNILKVYQAISHQIEQNPSHKDRFPYFAPDVKPILAKGCTGPLEGELHSAQYFHGRDGLGGITERHPELSITEAKLKEAYPNLVFSDKSGVDVAIDILRSHAPRSVTYIALGPLTTLATIMRQQPELFRDRIGRVVCMGGALDVPGNTSPVAEFNFFADPFAVKELLMPAPPLLGLPLDRFILLPLDTTTSHELPFPFYRQHVDPAFDSSSSPSLVIDKSPIAHFTSSFLEKTREVMLSFGKDCMELHDIVAVWCAIENPPQPDNQPIGLSPKWQARTRKFDVERTGELTRGMLVVDRRDDDQSAYAPGINRSEIQKEFGSLDHAKCVHGEWESTVLPAQVEVETAAETHTPGSGVLCITQTPGPDVLLKILMGRVWGVAA